MPPDKAKFDFAGVDCLYRRLIDGTYRKDEPVKPFLRGYYGLPLSGELFDSLVSDFAKLLFSRTYTEKEDVEANEIHSTTIKIIRKKGRKPDACFTALRILLSKYYGQVLDYKSGSSLAWRIAAGAKLMAKGISTLGEFCPCDSYWTGLRIDEVNHVHPSKEGKPMLELVLRIYDGIFAGLRFTQRMPYRFVIAKLARDIGFQIYQKVHKNELVGAHFGGLLTCDSSGPRIAEFYSSMSINKANRDVRKDRTLPCLKGYRWLCHQCTIGYMKCDDNQNSAWWCPRGTHSTTFVKQTCPACLKEAWFDPALNSKICIECKHHTAIETLKRNGGQQ